MEIQNKIWLFFASLLGLGGTLFLIIAWNAWSQTYTIVRNGKLVQGTVIENVHKPRRGLQTQTTSLAPVVAFTTENGETVRYYSQTYTTPAAYAPGEQVDIWYMPDNPQLATMDGLDAWVLPTVFGIFGTAMSLIGWGGLISGLLKNRKSRTDQFA